MQTPPPIPTIAPLALWRIARAFLDVLFNLFGAPEDVAARQTLTRAAHKLFASWLRAGEAMMRRLIAIEAAAYENDHTPAPKRTPRKRQRRLMEFWPDQPQEWRVSFQCIAPSIARAHGGDDRAAVGAGASSRPRTARDPRFLSAWPLAERYEALLRAFNHPAPFARRLARRLYAAPAQLQAVLTSCADYDHRVDRADAFTQLALRAWPALNSS